MMALPDPGSGSLVWRRSTFCTATACVEVAFSGSTVLVRDSESPDGPILKCSDSVWHAFLCAAVTEKYNSDRPT
jgi:Domain of unknown function (DUF397)